MKKKVLYVVSTLRMCGPINQLYGIVTNIDPEHYEIKILTLTPEPDHTRYQDFLDAGIAIDTLGLSRMQFMLKGKSKLKAYIQEEQPDIIHTTGVRVDTAVAKLGFGEKQIMSIRNYAYEDYVAKFGKVMGTIFANDTIKAIEKAHSPVCCSYSLKELYASHTDKDLAVVQNGVDIKRFSPATSEEEKFSLRKELNIPLDKTILIAVGSLIKRKDPVTMIRAFKKANQSKNAVFIFLGDGNLMEECKSEANEQIILKGNVANVTDYLRASDVYVSASHSEGLPNSVLEAGRTGVDMILSDIPQHKEVFMHGITPPSLFKVGNEEDLQNIIENHLQTSSKSINRELVDYIEDYFSNQSMSTNYQEIYQTISK